MINSIVTDINILVIQYIKTIDDKQPHYSTPTTNPHAMYWITNKYRGQLTTTTYNALSYSISPPIII